jgi:[histone H3]-lysine27 N-methyltransferase
LFQSHLEIIIDANGNKSKLLPFVPSDDFKRGFEQMTSLATAFTATKAEFSNELTYMPGMAPRDANSPAIKRQRIQVLTKEDTKTLNLWKTIKERGVLLMIFCPIDGFTVEANKSIKFIYK